MKLTVLGGGGVRSPFLAKSIALEAKASGIDRVAFMDISEKKLNIYGSIAKKISNMIDPSLDFVLTSDASLALCDADYVITTIRAEADDGRVFDERTALNKGVLGQETTGAGGFAMALRSIPVIAGYCELMKKVSKPDALMFNFTNPSGLVAQAMRTMGYNNVYGICDAPSGFYRQLSGVIGSEITAECFGLNHLSWFYDFKKDSQPADELILNHPLLYKETDVKLFDKSLVKMFGNMLPNEYLYFYFNREKAVNSILSGGKTRGETIMEINRSMEDELSKMNCETQFDEMFECFMKHHALRDSTYFSIESGQVCRSVNNIPTPSQYINQAENGSYAAVALSFIRARNSEHGESIVLNVPNNGAIPFLSCNDVVEITCTVDRNGVYTHPVKSFTPVQETLIRTIKAYENLTVEAILEKDRLKAIEALTIHPLVNSYKTACELVSAYTKRYESYIGKWES